MRHLAVATSALVLAGLLATSREGACGTLTVGPGKMFDTPCKANAAAQDGDEIDIDPGTYAGDTCTITAANITMKGVGGRAVMDATGIDIAQKKGILVVDGENTTIENIEFTGAAISQGDGENGAGIRMENHALVIRGCYFHDNQDGILATPGGEGGTLLIDESEFAHNGLGDGCNDGNGCTHNMYIRELDSFTFQNSWSHDVVQGHLIKSRARKNIILYSRIGSEGNTSSSIEINLCEGGESYIIGNTIQKDSAAGNSNLLTFGDDQLGPNGNDLFIVGNTFVNDHAGGNFVLLNRMPTMLVMHDNIFAGAGNIVSPAATVSADNLSGADPLFVDPATYDYHLQAGSPAIGIAVDPGSGPDMSLAAVFEYVHPLSSVARGTEHDAGAYEYDNSAPSTGGASAAGGSGGAAQGGEGPGAGSGGVTSTGTGGSTNPGAGGATSAGPGGATGTAGSTAGGHAGTAGHGGASGSTGSAGKAATGGNAGHGTGGSFGTGGVSTTVIGDAGNGGVGGTSDAVANNADSGDSGGCSIASARGRSGWALGILSLAALASIARNRSRRGRANGLTTKADRVSK